MDWIEVRVSTTSEGTEAVFGVLLSCGIQGAQIIDDQEMRRFLREHPYTWDYIDEKLGVFSDEIADEQAYVVFYVSPDPAGREILALVKDRLRGLTNSDPAYPYALGSLDSLGSSGSLGSSDSSGSAGSLGSLGSAGSLGSLGSAGSLGSSGSLASLCPLGSLAVEESAVSDETWLHEWKKYYKPFKLGRAVVVKPAWEHYEAAPGEVVFTIDPGAVFGTGLHPSTQLCVEALEDYISPEGAVLDIGCGSGILSIIALLLGADTAVACDYEPAAAVNAADNARLNGLDLSRYTLCTGDIFTDENVAALINRRRYDVVIANIVADVVMALAAPAKGYLKPGGVFIASGIIAERLQAVRAAFAEAGLLIISVLERDGWNCLVCQNIL